MGSKSPSEYPSKNKPKMALRVPLARRDFFFEDPFFASVWEDFEKLRRDIWSGHGSFLQNGDFWPASRFSSVFPEKRWFYPENFFDDDKFKVSLDTHGFQPEDLQIKVKDNIVNIEAKHEEKKSDSTSKSYSSKHLSKSYTLPQGCKMEDVKSNLSADGILMVSAPKKNPPKSVRFARSVP